MASGSSPRARGAFLLSTFDEAVLTHSLLPMPVPDADHPGFRAAYGEAGGGPVLWDLHQVGVWKRTANARGFTVVFDLVPGLPGIARESLRSEAHALARRVGASGATVRER